MGDVVQEGMLESHSTEFFLKDKEHGISSCCFKTVDQHVEHNSMMVCQICNFIIKCFTNESEYRRYVLFCKSRQRKIQFTRRNNYYIVVFRSYRH